MDIRRFLEEKARDYPDKTAVIFKEEEVNFPLLKGRAFKIGRFLLDKGISRQGKAAVFMPNNLEAVYSFLGVFSIGRTIVPLDFMLAEEEVINFINYSNAEFLFAEERRGIDFDNIKAKCRFLKGLVLCKEKEGFASFSNIWEIDDFSLPELNWEEENLAGIFYTSGSTGRPKGVMLTYRNLNNPIKTAEHFLEISSSDTLICPGVPFSHIGGLDYILFMAGYGQTLILLEKFRPLHTLKSISEYKASWMWLVPSMYVAMLSLKDYGKFDLDSLRYVIVFGAPSSPELLKRFHKLCPNAYLLNGWGMTETSAPNCVLPPGNDKIESIGKFAPFTEARVVDDEGENLPAGKRGNLLVKGEGIMQGYYKEDVLTKEAFTDDGWLKTGDRVYYDEDGLFYIAGRKKDMIKTAGEIVFLPEIERAIMLHPKVRDAAVISVPDRLRGEVPKAFVEVEEGVLLTEEELKGFLKKHLAHFKIPHYFEFVNSLPKNRAGKIDKQDLHLRSARRYCR